MIFASQEQQETSAETRSPEYKQHQEALNSLQSKRKEKSRYYAVSWKSVTFPISDQVYGRNEREKKAPPSRRRAVIHA